MMNKNINAIMVSVAILASGSSCQPEKSVEDNGGIEAATFLNVNYGTDASQNMDVYLPANRSRQTTPAIILIHGGAWVSGDKSEFTPVVTALKNRLPDYAMFNVNYRLLGFDGSNPWPAQKEDINSVLSFINAKAAEYRFDSSRVVLIGASAGAHLALLKAYTDNVDDQIKVVIDLFGPTDIVKLYQNPPDPSLPALLGFFLNGTPDTNLAAYEAASPLYQVRSGLPPTIIFHGTEDDVVPIGQSDSLHNRLMEAGVDTELIIYDGEGHGWSGMNLSDTYTRTVNFIQKYIE